LSTGAGRKALGALLCATPARYSFMTRRTYIIATNGVVFYKDLGKSKFVTDYPPDPGGAG
jgi:hypothetical protein